MKSAFGYIAHSFRAEIGDGVVGFGPYLLSRWLLAFASRQALWALGVAAVLYGAVSAAPYLPSDEWGVVIASTAIMVYAGHFLVGLPEVGRWAVLALRLWPRRLARLALYRIAMDAMTKANAWVERRETPLGLRLAADLTSRFTGKPHEEVAWDFAVRLETRFWVMLGKAALSWLLPVVGVIALFRTLVTHGDLLDRSAHLTMLEACVYPIAALLDAVAGTELRSLLTHR